MQQAMAILKARNLVDPEFDFKNLVWVDVNFTNRAVQMTDSTVYIRVGEHWTNFSFKTDVPGRCAMVENGKITVFDAKSFTTYFANHFNHYLNGLPNDQRGEIVVHK